MQSPNLFAATAYLGNPVNTSIEITHTDITKLATPLFIDNLERHDCCVVGMTQADQRLRIAT